MLDNMKIQSNYNLSKLNTFGISVNAKFFVEVNNEEDLAKIFNLPDFKNVKKIFLGGGSNVLFLKDFDGLVILNKLKGVKISREDSENVLIRSMGGESWNNFVNFAVERDLWGVENLASIPGTVGAAPMQNIGAYGAEIKNVLENVETFNFDTGEKKIFNREECKLGYRDSIFKNELKDKSFITAVTFKLNKTSHKNVDYKVLRDYLEKNKIKVKHSKDISDAVSAIRKDKLPNPAVTPNAGSFFKNVFVEESELERLQKIYPDIPNFDDEGIVKIPAGWLIEQCGWKGKRVGNVGVHDKQALVLVNYGGAIGEEILALANLIISDVKEKFGLDLIPEVNLI